MATINVNKGDNRDIDGRILYNSIHNLNTYKNITIEDNGEISTLNRAYNVFKRDEKCY